MTFNWKFRNLNVSGDDIERHFVCSTTKAKKCLTYAPGMKFKKASYALQNSEQYKYKTEEELCRAAMLAAKSNQSN